MLVAVSGGLLAIAALSNIVSLPGLTRAVTDGPLTVPVRRQSLSVIVTERGSLESMVTVDGICELMGREIKIISLVPEGTHVEKGAVVCKFDASDFEKNVAEQEIKVKQAQTKVATTKEDIEIQRNDGESKVAEAVVEHKLADLNVTKYKEGDYRAELADSEGNIALNSQKREEAANKLEQTKELVKKGFRSLDQLRAVEQEHSQYKSFVERDQLKLQVKKNYEYELKTTELQSKMDQAKSKIDRARATLKSQVAKATSEYESATATARIEGNRLDELKEQLSKTVITAAQSGVVAYANERYWDPSSQIREGAMVYPRQKIFSLPDMTKMQVVVNIHESLIKKVKVDQTAEIRLESYPGLVLVGKVKTVAQLADSTRSWDSGGAKVYKTVITIEKMPEEQLRPGMTAEVKILVKTLPSVLIVPLQAVAEHKGDHFAFKVDASGKIELKNVKVGETSEKHVEILDGLKEGDIVALDARARTEAEFKDEDEKDKTGEKAPEPPSPGAAPASTAAPVAAAPG